MKDFGSIKNAFCLTKRDVANCGKVRFPERKRPSLDSHLSLTLSPLPSQQENP